MDWQDTSFALLRGKISPDSLSVARLFEISSLAAINNDFGARVLLCFMICSHPKATRDDILLAKVYVVDMYRRLGDPGLALKILNYLPEPVSFLPKAEYWQARGQCYLMLERIPEALQIQRQIVNYASCREIPVDKLVYYLETFIQMKLKSGRLDAELEKALVTYYGLLQEMEDGPKRQRAVAFFHDLQGKRYVLTGDFESAVGQFFRSFEAHAGNLRYQVVVCLFYLDAAILGKFCGGEEWEQMAAFFGENRGLLQEAQKKNYSTQYMRVTQYLGIS